MGHGTRKSLTFSTTTTNKSLSTTTNKVVTKLARTTLKVSPPKKISLHKVKQETSTDAILLYGTEVVSKAEAHIVEKVGQRVAAKIVTRVEHKAEKPVIENVVM
ncbi:hypothetical protein IGI04_040010, partial [Brassica rapa subsp. trilocularis]